MTKPLVISPEWRGETVAVLGNAPCLLQELERLPRPMHAIACNQAAAKAPWAEMMVSIDANWLPEVESYPGIRIVGFERDGLDAYFLHIPHEIVTVAPGHDLHIRSNLLAAIRIAAQAGAARILLVGIDPEYYEANLAAPGTVAGLAAVTRELAAAGIVVERFDPGEAAGIEAPTPPTGDNE
ncbi:MAG: hypothetical protein K2X55_01000 [Burkholderiaceae bacterium]|nr:hypothetical protein [Burkholderiaceae bacterium]